jgi:von Willebrand factor type A domain
VIQPNEFSATTGASEPRHTGPGNRALQHGALVSERDDLGEQRPARAKRVRQGGGAHQNGFENERKGNADALDFSLIAQVAMTGTRRWQPVASISIFATRVRMIVRSDTDGVMVAFVSRSLSTTVLLGTVAIACGARTELYSLGAPAQLPPGDDATGDGGAKSALLDATPDAPGLEDARGDGALTCTGKAIDLTLVAPNLYFVLDHSTSMQDMSKWTNVRQVVSQLITQIGAGARFGAAMFPGTSAENSCEVGVEVMSLRQGDAQGSVAGAFLTATAAQPLGGTPTAQTLESLVPRLSSLPGTTYAILATDGGPDCDRSTTCNGDQCTNNLNQTAGCPVDGSINCCVAPYGTPLGCLDTDAAAKGAADLAGAGVKTFVIGFPGSEPYDMALDRLAIAGDTARAAEPFYYPVATSDTAALAAVFAQIVAQTGAGCVFTLANQPASLAGMRVILNGTPVLAGGTDGWSLSGKTLTLHGASCVSVQTAGAPSLEFLEGCGS